MEYEEKQARYKWLTSQKRWHSKHKGAWHLSQSQFYESQGVSCFTFSDLLKRTFSKRSDALERNVTKSNALYRSLGNFVVTHDMNPAGVWV